MSDLFRQKMAVLFLLNAALIPAIMLNKELFTSGAFILSFIFIQIIIVISFAAAEDAGHYEWWAFWLTVAGSAFVFFVLTNGRSLTLEWIGFFLFAAYIASAILFLLLKNGSKTEATTSSFSDQELEQFRRKDEMQDILNSYSIPDVPKQRHLTDYPDFKKQAKQNMVAPEAGRTSEPKNQAIFKQELQKSWEDKGIMQIDENEGYYEIKPTVTYTQDSWKEDEEEGYLELYPDDKLAGEKVIKVKELKETPTLDVESLRQNTQEIRKKSQSIDEKIKLIAEKAILEGAQKRLERALDVKKKLAKKPLKKNNSYAYSSITGNTFHTDKKCIAAKRIKKKDIILYATAAKAKAKGLTPCSICRNR